VIILDNTGSIYTVMRNCRQSDADEVTPSEATTVRCRAYERYAYNIPKNAINAKPSLLAHKTNVLTECAICGCVYTRREKISDIKTHMPM
jgi:hypothetical protein